jgi:hypothetical protein
MRVIAFTAATALLAAAAGSAAAAPSIEIRHAAARVTIVPEARSDVQVTVVRANGRLPMQINHFGDATIVDGPLGHRSPNCNEVLGQRSVFIWGIGRVAYADLPQIVVRTPLDAHVVADGAVYGVVGRGHSLDLSNGGCGDWTVADQDGALHIHTSGSGDVHAGSAGAADIRTSGSSDISLKGVREGLTASITGSGDVVAAWVNGPLHAHIAGSGDVSVKAGQVSDMDASIAGSGDVKFGGVARSLTAHIAGSGDVDVARVNGPVSRQIAGSGDVNVGQ